MALFKRKSKDSVLPEIDKYYDGERRDRTGLAWLLALISVISVTIVVVGIFAGGRWAYQQITNKDTDQIAVNDNGDEEIIPDFDGAIAPSDDEADSSGEHSNESISNDSDTQDSDEDSGRVDAPARTDTPSGPVAQVPTTGDSPLPGTGPANTIGVFAIISIMAGGAHYLVARKQQG